MGSAREPFPQAFRTLLHQILARAPRRTGAVAEEVRSVRRRLSQSGVFTGHRPYAVGDDLRRIDWNAYARGAGLQVKLLEEEERRASAILLDVSASMLAGSPERFTGALRLGAILGGLALRGMIGLCIDGGGRRLYLEGADSTARLLDFLVAMEPTAEVSPVRRVQELLRRGAPGKVVWVSDFAEPQAIEPALAMLRRHGCEVVGWQPVVADDLRAPGRGWLRLWDPETGAEEMFFVDDALARQMDRELAHLRRRQELAFAAVGYPLQRFPLPAPADFTFRSWVEAGWRFRH